VLELFGLPEDWQVADFNATDIDSIPSLSPERGSLFGVCKELDDFD
jgi:hypothetical protein